MTTRKPALVERSMKRTARIVGLATAFLIGGATLAIAQPWDARYGYYAVPFLRAILQFGAPLFSRRLSRRSSLPILGPLLLLGGGPLGLLALLGLALTGVGCSRNKSGSLALFAAIRRASSRVARVTFFVPPRY